MNHCNNKSSAICLLLMLLLTVIPYQTGAQSLISGDLFTNCPQAPFIPEKLVAYIDWPFTLDCDDIKINDTSQASQCYVSSPNIAPVLSNYSISLTSSSPNETIFTLYRVYNETECLSKTVRVELRSLPSRSCFDDVNYHVTRNLNVIERSYEFSDVIRLDCQPDPRHTGSAVYPPYVSPALYRTTWRVTRRGSDGHLISRGSCSDFGRKYDPKVHFHEQDSSVGRPAPLTIYQAHYFNPGVYSCEVTYGGQTAYIAHYSICIKNSLQITHPVVKCNDVIQFVEGETTIIDCDVHAMNGRVTENELEITWIKEEEILCTNRNLSTNAISPIDKRLSCGMKNFLNHDPKCFKYVPREELSLYQDQNVFKIFQTIRNIEKDDQGKYVVFLKYKNVSAEPFIVELKYDPRFEHEKMVIILSVVLALIIAIATMTGLVCYNRIQILLFVRRHFGKYDEDHRPFVATLSYFYTNDMPPNIQEMIKKIVLCIRQRMKEINYNFCDDHENLQLGPLVTSLLENLSKSHRMIIVLTPSYIRDSKTRFEAQQGFISMLKKQIKVIIVRTPGVESALQEVDGQNFTKELRELMLASRNIHWKNEMSDQRFMDHIQYALPNLNR